MANLSITITNNLYAIGEDPTTITTWGNFLWGTGKWLYSSTDLAVQVNKLITNSLAPTTAESFLTNKLISNSIIPSDLFNIDLLRVISNSLSLGSDASSEELKSGTWNYVFVKPSIDAEDRNLTSFTEDSSVHTTWTSGVVTSTIWSET